MKAIQKILLLTVLCLCYTGMLHAQLPGLPVGDPDVSNAPVDGGLSLLVAAGIGYGAKQLRKNNKRNIK
ncbi:MAG: hypothetical protein J0I09_14715 [Sphingobacteriia bacterium]|nr:hypothetical protein [Sphingobacteriia bacterium]